MMFRGLLKRPEGVWSDRVMEGESSMALASELGVGNDTLGMNMFPTALRTDLEK